jgi:PKD repeat protein
MKITANRVFRKYLSLLFLLTATTLLRAQVPVASFTSSQDSGCAPLLVNFINTSTGAVSYQWSLGNGNNSTLTNPSTSYINSGAYTVVLIATSATGIKDTIVSTITILGDPVADFNASAFSGCEDQNSILFTNISVGASSYIWDFGDGSSSNATNPPHILTLRPVRTMSSSLHQIFSGARILRLRIVISPFMRVHKLKLPSTRHRHVM